MNPTETFLHTSYIQLAQSNPEDFFTRINDFAVISCTGEDAKSFLQGQISADMEKVSASKATLACCLNLKGRAISSFIVLLVAQDQFNLIVPKNVAEKTLSALKTYAIFSKVKLEIASKRYQFLGLAATDREDSPIHDLGFNTEQLQQPYDALQFESQFIIRLPGASKRYLWLGEESLLASKIQKLTNHLLELNENFWQGCEILAKEIYIDAISSEQIIPNILNYAELGGISFDKGCYKGQEVVARLHYRGESKEHMQVAYTVWDAEPATLQNGSIITSPDRKTIGRVLKSVSFKPHELLIIMTLKKDYTGPIQVDNNQFEKLHFL